MLIGCHQSHKERLVSCSCLCWGLFSVKFAFLGRHSRDLVLFHTFCVVLQEGKIRWLQWCPFDFCSVPWLGPWPPGHQIFHLLLCGAPWGPELKVHFLRFSRYQCTPVFNAELQCRNCLWKRSAQVTNLNEQWHFPTYHLIKWNRRIHYFKLPRFLSCRS